MINLLSQGLVSISQEVCAEAWGKDMNLFVTIISEQINKAEIYNGKTLFSPYILRLMSN